MPELTAHDGTAQSATFVQSRDLKEAVGWDTSRISEQRY
jgi:hypothetical protein